MFVYSLSYRNVVTKFFDIPRGTFEQGPTNYMFGVGMPLNKLH